MEYKNLRVITYQIEYLYITKMSKNTPKLAFDAGSNSFVMLDTVKPNALNNSLDQTKKKKNARTKPLVQNPIPGSAEFNRAQQSTQHTTNKKKTRRKKEVLKPPPSEWKWSGMTEFIPLIDYLITHDNTSGAESSSLAYLTLLRSMSDVKGRDSCYTDYDRLKNLVQSYQEKHPETCQTILRMFDTYFPDF